MQITYDHVMSCYACDAPIVLGRNRYDELHRTKAKFYCPHGHGQVFTGETEEQKRIRALERQLADANRVIERYAREASMHQCLHPRCSFESSSKQTVRLHMMSCEKAGKVKRLPADAGPSALNSKVA